MDIPAIRPQYNLSIMEILEVEELVRNNPVLQVYLTAQEEYIEQLKTDVKYWRATASNSPGNNS